LLNGKIKLLGDKFMTSIVAKPFPRIITSQGCNNGRVQYGYFVPTRQVTPNYRFATLGLRELFGADSKVIVDVIRATEDDSPTITIAGHPGDEFISRHSRYRYQIGGGDGANIGTAIYGVTKPHNIGLNPYLRFSNKLGFYDYRELITT